MPIKVMPKTMDDSSDMESSTSSSFFRRVRACMLIGGTYPGMKNKRQILSCLMMVYVGVFWIVWTGSLAAYMATIYIKLSKSRDITRIVVSSILTLAAFYPSVINSFLIPKNLRQLEELFGKYEEKYGFTSFFKKWTQRIKVIIVILPIFNCSFVITELTKDKQLKCTNYPSCEFPEPWRTVSQSTSLVASTMAYFLFQTTFVVFNVVAYILLKEFDRVSKRFQKISTMDRDKQEQEFKACAEHYDDLVDLLSTASDFTQHFSLAILFLCLPLACCYMYTALVKEVTATDIAELAFGAVCVTTTIGVWLLTQANVSLKAQEPLQYLWKLKTDNFTQNGMQNVQMLVSRLTGDSPGYSVYGLVTINMPTVLSVVATMAAYAIIVVQFRSPSSPSCPALLNSSLVS